MGGYIYVVNSVGLNKEEYSEISENLKNTTNLLELFIKFKNILEFSKKNSYGKKTMKKYSFFL